MDFPINAKAEGRILVPWEHRKLYNVSINDPSCEFIQRLGSSLPFLNIIFDQGISPHRLVANFKLTGKAKVPSGKPTVEPALQPHLPAASSPLSAPSPRSTLTQKATSLNQTLLSPLPLAHQQATNLPSPHRLTPSSISAHILGPITHRATFSPIGARYQYCTLYSRLLKDEGFLISRFQVIIIMGRRRGILMDGMLSIWS